MSPDALESDEPTPDEPVDPATAAARDALALPPGSEASVAPHWPTAEGHPRQCTRVRKDGTRCQLFAMHGTVVCYRHGGMAPGVRAAARRRLLSLVDPALSALDRVVTAELHCPHCHKACGHLPDTPSAVKASTVILDRTGFGPQSKIELEHAENTWLRYLTDEELETVLRLMDRAKARVAAAGGAEEVQEPTD